MIPNHSLFELSICNTPEPMAALAFDWTLEDLERFCTDPEEYVVLSVDPHLEFGQFSRYRDHIPAPNAGIQASETRK